MSEWKEFYLSELGTLARGKSKHRPRWAKHLYGGAYPFIQTGEISAANKYIEKYSQTYSEAGLAQSKLWTENTLCITIAANIAEIAILKIPACFPDSVLGFIPNTESADLDFIFYILKHFQTRLQQLAIGSVQDNLSLGSFLDIKFSLPSLNEQKEIADVLSTLDRKIENLRKQNETLEEIARSIFKYWFIDFEFPNPDSKPYKSSGGAMVRSELGDIPEGWRVGKLGDVATNNSETHKFEDKDKIIFVNTGDVLDGKFLHENYMSVNTLPGQAKKRIAKHDILYSEIRPKNKHFAYINFERNLENYVVSTKFMVVRANDSILPRLLYLILKRQESIDEFNYIAESRSGTFPQITFEAVSHFQFPLPPIDIQKYLMPIFTNLMEKKEFNVIKIETLTKTRDALLPKLMSGQLRVKE